MKKWISILALLFTFIPAVYAGTVCPDAVVQAEIDVWRIALKEHYARKKGLTADDEMSAWLLSEINHFEGKYTDKTFVTQQVMMYGLIKSGDDDSLAVFLILLNILDVDNVTRLQAALPFLDPTDEMIRCILKEYATNPTPLDERGIANVPYYTQKMGRTMLELATINIVTANGSVVSRREKALRDLPSTDVTEVNDFSVIEDYLKAHPNAWPDGLVTFLYQRSPVDAVQIMAKLLGTEKDIADVAAHIEGELNAKSIEYFANRPEWWARLYVAVQIRDAGRLSPELAKQIGEDPHPLIQRVLTERRPSW